MNSIEEYVTQVLEEVRENNPYPESIFVPPTKEQCEMAHEALKQVGMTLDKFSASMGKLVWNNCVDEISKQMLGE